jgi:hypothetical protein
VKISQAIIVLVETALPKGTLNRVMVVQIKWDIDNLKTDNAFSEFLHFVIFNESNYTFVGVCDFEMGFMHLDSETKITRKSYHDSAWRSDGIESTIWKKADEINAKLTSSPDWSIYISFGLFGAKVYNGSLINLESFEDGGVRFVPTLNN